MLHRIQLLYALVTQGVTAQVQAGVTAQYAALGLPATGLDAATAALLGLPSAVPSIAAATAATAAPLIGQSIAGRAAPQLGFVQLGDKDLMSSRRKLAGDLPYYRSCRSVRCTSG